MVKLRDIKIKPKLIGLFIAAALLPLFLFGVITYCLVDNALMQKS